MPLALSSPQPRTDGSGAQLLTPTPRLSLIPPFPWEPPLWKCQAGKCGAQRTFQHGGSPEEPSGSVRTNSGLKIPRIKKEAEKEDGRAQGKGKKGGKEEGKEGIGKEEHKEERDEEKEGGKRREK